MLLALQISLSVTPLRQQSDALPRGRRSEIRGYTLLPESATVLTELRGVTCLGSCVPLQHAVSQPISIDKDSNVYRQVAHLPERTFLFQEPKWMSQRGVLSFPAFHIIMF